MMRRGFVVTLLALFFSTAMAGVALAADPVPSPPPLCFVMKDGALPVCEQNRDGTWTAIYPDSGGNHDDGGGSSTTRNVGIAAIIAALGGIGIIVYRTWLKPQPVATTPDNSDLPPARLSGASVEPPAPQAPSPAQAEPPAASPPPPTTSRAQQLAELNALRNQGAISPEEYEARRQAIITETS